MWSVLWLTSSLRSYSHAAFCAWLFVIFTVAVLVWRPPNPRTKQTLLFALIHFLYSKLSYRPNITFYIFCWPCISSRILANNQFGALFHVFFYLFHLSICFEYQVLIIRRSNCINISSGMISLFKWLLGTPVKRELQSVTQTNHTRWWINKIRSPDDEHLMLETCREMK
jgi:hypothetical protein